MNVETLKEKFLGNIELWLKGRIDDMVKNNSAMSIPAVYMKRGCHNIVCKYKGEISKSVDNVALFLADENGNIDANTLFADAMNIFKGMEESSFDMGMVKGIIGKGRISISLPNNVLMNVLFGSEKAITFNESDFLQLKSLLLKD